MMVETKLYAHIWCSMFVEWINCKKAFKKLFSTYSKFPIVPNTLYPEPF